MKYIINITYFDKDGRMVDSGFATNDGWLVKMAFEEYMEEVRKGEQYNGNGFSVRVEDV